VLFEIVFEGPQAGTTGTTLKFFFSKTFLLDEFGKKLQSNQNNTEY